MDELLKNKAIWVIFIVLGFILGALFLNNYLISRVTDRVIERLQRNYVPGPYSPGYDPDKINSVPRGGTTPTTPPSRPHNGIPQVDPISSDSDAPNDPRHFRPIRTSKEWEDDWEAQRHN